MKRQNPVFLWVFLFSALLLCAANQFDFAATLQRKLTAYYERNIPVKIHVTFNQPKYAAGDTAYFKVYFFTADRYQPIGGRQIVNLNLLDEDRQVMHQSRVLLNNGVGSSALPLPITLSPGRYTIVAFDEAMKNADASLFFQGPLWIAGPFKFEESPGSELKFYPEGGHLIAGITNKVVVKGPANSIANIFSGDGAQIATAPLDAQGLGLFFVEPRQDQKYFASLARNSTKVDLPPVEADGVGMLVTVPLNKMPVRVTVQVPVNSSLRLDDLHLAMTSHGKVYSAAALSFREKNFVTLAFPQDNLLAGVARFSVFKGDGTMISERLVYIQAPSPPSAHISLGKKVFSVREEIPFNLSIVGDDKKPLASNLTVSVYKEDFMETERLVKNLSDNVLLFGDLAGSLNIPEHFSIHEPDGLSDLDLFLVTQKWQRFSWQDVWGEKVPTTPFRSYLHVEGRAFQSDNNPLPDSTLITFFLQKSVMVYEVFADRSGEFDFSMLIDFYGDEEIFYRAESQGRFLPNVKVSLDSGIHFSGKIPPMKQVEVTDPFHTFNAQRSKIDKSYAFHLLERTYEKPASLNALIEEEVFGADIAVNMDDFFLFPTMSETLREIVPMVQHRRNRNRDVVKLFFDDRDRFAEGEPLFVIDGVITDNTTYFVNLKPVDVVSIKVINSAGKLQSFGAIGKNGMVLVETKIAGHAAQVPRSEYTFSARGLTRASQEFHAEAAIKGVKVPDLRTNLFWDPVFETDSTGRGSATFMASDVTGTYKVKVEGFTERGEPLHAEETFQIVFNPD